MMTHLFISNNEMICLEVFEKRAINPKEKFSHTYQTDARKEPKGSS